MKGDQLNPQQILAVGNAARHGEVVPSVSGDEIVNSPDCRRGVKVVLGNLEPVGTIVRSSGCVINLRKPVCNRTLVGSGNGVVGMLPAVDVGPPEAADLGTRWDGQDRAVRCSRLTAGHVGRVDVLNWEVGAWGSQANELTHVLTVDGDGLGAESAFSKARNSSGCAVPA